MQPEHLQLNKVKTKLTIEVVAVTYRSEQQYNIRRGYTTYINHIRYQ